MKESKRLLNNDIKASKVRLITEDGEVLGEMSLDEAKAKSKELSLDLMQLGYDENLAVVKMLDYGKFLYKQKKQEQKNKQKTKTPDIKTIKISFKIGDHDLEFKKNQCIKFSQDGNPLKVILTLRGRENHYESIAMTKMETFVSMLDEYYKIDKRIVKNGNNFIAMMNVK